LPDRGRAASADLAAFYASAAIDRCRARWHGMIAAMARHGQDPIAKFIRWLDDARRLRIPNYEAMALATARAVERHQCGSFC
jgi:pyridoxine/pyridoxamine 5'-phosphate oxidase